METHHDRELGKARCCSGRGRITLFINGALFFSSILLSVWTLHRYGSCSSLPGGVSLVPKQLEASDSHYPLSQIATFSPKTFAADLGSESIYKGPPRDELDGAWNKLVDHPMILVDKETLHKFDQTSKPTKGADGHFYATVEVFHYLHCLDITRKFIWRDYYQHIDTFQNPPERILEHIDHCIDLLRQVLMCHGDVGLLFYTDVQELQPEARVSTQHMCRNFTQIVEWVAEHDSELGIFAEA